MFSRLGVFGWARRGGGARKKFGKLEVWPGGRVGGSDAGARRGNAGRLTWRAGTMVFWTFITHEFSKGPWTSAVQGEKFSNYFREGGRVATGRFFGVCHFFVAIGD